MTTSFGTKIFIKDKKISPDFQIQTDKLNYLLDAQLELIDKGHIIKMLIVCNSKDVSAQGLSIKFQPYGRGLEIINKKIIQQLKSAA